MRFFILITVTSNHSHNHSHGIDRAAQSRVLWISFVVNALYMGVELVGGILFHSLALLADAVHMFSDVAGLGIALIALRLLQRPRSAKHTYGLQRAEVLGALFNGLLLLAVAGWIIYEAIRRFGEPQDVMGGGLLVVAVIGLMVNLGSALILAVQAGASLNMRGAVVHMSVDAAGSVGVIIAALAVILYKANWVDPAVSLLIAGLVLWSVYGLLRDTVNVLLEGAPRGLNLEKIQHTLTKVDGVKTLHHLHVWNLASDTPALSAHVVLEGKINLHAAQLKSDELEGLLQAKFGIDHATLEMECHDCEIVSETSHAVREMVESSSGARWR